MIEVKLQARLRTGRGKSAARKVRREGLIPAVVYGHGEEAVSICIEEKAFRSAMQSVAGENVIVDLELDGEGMKQTIIKEIQVDPVTQNILHVDFQHVHKGEEVVVEVPIIARGVPQGVKEGGILDHILRKVEVRCLPSKIPDRFEVDVSDLGIGDSLHLSVIDFSDGQILADDSISVLSVIAPKAKEEVPVVEEEVEVPEEAEAEAVEEEEKKEEEKKEKKEKRD